MFELLVYSKKSITIFEKNNDLWFEQVLDHINILPILGDNMSSIKITKNDKFHKQTKHINI